MQYPPSPWQVILALSFSHITQEEAQHMINLWEEKHRKELQKDGEPK